MKLFKDKELNVEYPLDTPINENLTLYVVKKDIRPQTKTSILEDGKKFNIKPINIDAGNIVILALYNNNRLIDVQFEIYKGEEILFTTSETYTDAKVMVWSDLTNLIPVCSAETLEF